MSTHVLPADDPMSAVARFLAAAVSPLSGHRTPVGDSLDEAMTAVATSHRDLAMVCAGTLVVWRDITAYELASDLVTTGRAKGLCGFLPTVLFFHAESELFAGRHAAALSTAAEALRIAEDTGQRQWLSQVNGLLAYLAALAGDEEACRGYADAARAEAGMPWTQWALGILDRGLGRIDAALTQRVTLSG